MGPWPCGSRRELIFFLLSLKDILNAHMNHVYNIILCNNGQIPKPNNFIVIFKTQIVLLLQYCSNSQTIQLQVLYQTQARFIQLNKLLLLVSILIYDRPQAYEMKRSVMNTYSLLVLGACENTRRIKCSFYCQVGTGQIQLYGWIG